jgi:Raf kinase inhibitor-like YbhB/YbcL family protein
MVFQLICSDFKEGEIIPIKHTCSGKNSSPALSWKGAPENTRSYSLILDDPDAPSGTFVHWVLFNIPADCTSLSENIQSVPILPFIGIQGINDFRRIGYGGPCPPQGQIHRYFFKLYALDTILHVKAGANKIEVEKEMKGHILAQAQIVGKFSR